MKSKRKSLKDAKDKQNKSISNHPNTSVSSKNKKFPTSLRSSREPSLDSDNHHFLSHLSQLKLQLSPKRTGRSITPLYLQRPKSPIQQNIERNKQPNKPSKLAKTRGRARSGVNSPQKKKKQTSGTSDTKQNFRETKLKKKAPIKKKKSLKAEEDSIPLPKAYFQSFLFTNSQETRPINIPQLIIQDSVLFKESEALIVNQIINTENQLHLATQAAILIQSWWRRLMILRRQKFFERDEPILKKSPRIFNFNETISKKYDNLSNFSSAQKSIQLPKSARSSHSRLRSKNSEQILSEVLKIADFCQIQGKFSLEKFKQNLIEAFKLSPRPPQQKKHQLTPRSKAPQDKFREHSSDKQCKQSSLVQSITRGMEQLKLNRMQNAQQLNSSSKLSRFFKRNQDHLKINLQNSFRRSKQLDNQDCLFTFQVFDDDQNAIQNISQQSAIFNRGSLGEMGSLNDSSEFNLPALKPEEYQNDDQREGWLIVEQKSSQRLIQDYLSGLITYSSRLIPTLQSNLNKIIGIKPSSELRYVRASDQDFEQQDCSISQDQFVINAAYQNSVFLQYDKLSNTVTDKMQAFFRQCLTKAVFDAFNDALDHQRPYGYFRKTPPWGQLSLYSGRSIPKKKGTVYEKLKAAEDRVLKLTKKDEQEQWSQLGQQQTWLRCTDDGLILRLSVGQCLEQVLIEELARELVGR